MTNHYDNRHLVYPTQLQSDVFWAVAGTVGSLIYSHSIERSVILYVQKILQDTPAFFSGSKSYLIGLKPVFNKKLGFFYPAK